MEESIKVSREYLKGFNEGYVLSKNMPELGSQISQMDLSSDRNLGFQDGRKQAVIERIEEKSKLKMRDFSASKNPQPEKSKGKDKGDFDRD